MREVAPGWEADGLRLLESRCGGEKIQALFSATPHVSPVSLASRVKGRLDHALRRAGPGVRYSRKLAVRTVGNNRTSQVEAYIRRQVSKGEFIDPRFLEEMRTLTVSMEHVYLAAPTETRSGHYWYNLHMVLVCGEHCGIREHDVLTQIREQCFRIAERKGYAIADLSVMPDHLHAALRGNIEHSPEEIVLSFQNNLAYALGQNRVWEDEYYVGTFSEYDMGAIRRAAKEASSPAGRAGRGRAQCDCGA